MSATPRGEAREHARRVAVAVGLVALAVALGALLVLTYHVLLLVFAGVLLAVMLRGIARPLHRRWGLAPKLAVFVVVAGLAGLGTVTALLTWPSVMAQVDELARQLPQMLADLRERARETQLGRDLLRSLPTLDHVVPDDGDDLVRKVGGVFSSTFGIVTGLFLILAVGLFLAFEPAVYVRGVLRLVPPARRPAARDLLDELREALFHWLLGRFVGMAVIGLLSWLGLTLLGVPLPLALGLLAALLTFIPNLGPILSVVPPVLLVLPEGLGAAGSVVALYAGIQLVENYTITPTVERIAVSLPPAVTITAQIVFGLLGGIPGLVLATPFAATVLVLVRRLYVAGVLGDDLDADVAATG